MLFTGSFLVVSCVSDIFYHLHRVLFLAVAMAGLKEIFYAFTQIHVYHILFALYVQNHILCCSF